MDNRMFLFIEDDYRVELRYSELNHRIQQEAKSLRVGQTTSLGCSELVIRLEDTNE